METTITNTPESAPPPAAPAAPAAAAPDNSAEIAALKAEVAETKRGLEFWYGKATTQASAPPPAPAPEPEPEEEIDVLDLIATQGTKGFDKFMKSRGYVSRAEVDATVNGVVNARTAQLSTEAELMENYPELRKRDSDFFKATAANYGELTRQGVPEAIAMKLGAQQAELQGYKSGKLKHSTPEADREATRLARIKAQSGASSSRAAATLEDEDDDELTSQELHICEAMGITPEAYKARAQKGVAMGMRHMPTRPAKKAA